MRIGGRKVGGEGISSRGSDEVRSQTIMTTFAALCVERLHAWVLPLDFPWKAMVF